MGNALFAEQYARNLSSPFRVVHYDDIVPHLPPPILGFEHAVYEVWYPAWDMPLNATHVVCTDGGEDPSCSDSANVIDLGLYGIQSHLEYYNIPIADCTVINEQQQPPPPPHPHPHPHPQQQPPPPPHPHPHPQHRHQQ